MRERPRLPPGHRLGRYQIVASLAIGGMGEVYRARDEELAREVAVKVLPDDWATDPERRRRFEQEARAAAALSHPNVLTIFDAGHESRRPFLVFELLEGMTLRARLISGALRPREALTLGGQAARGLAVAHAHAIVHRDLKPDNFFLTTSGILKLIDFGVAQVVRCVGPEDATDDELTPDGTAAPGTLSYMSPEQARLEATDSRSDIFSLGIVLYELLTGRHPFRRASPAETVTAILREEPPPMGMLDGRASGAIESLVRRCLEKRPQDRFQSANDLGLALDILARAEPDVDATAVPGQLALPSGLAEPPNPYPGLRSFTSAEADYFFGREADVTRLWEKIRRQPLLAIIGPSGVGKSSFLRAGLSTQLPVGWAVAVMTPGRAPVAALAQVLAPHLAGDTGAMTELVRGVVGLAEDDSRSDWLLGLLARWRDRHSDALLVIDQFEEIFTLSQAETRGTFTALIGRLVEETRIRVLLSVRDDFLFRCSEHPPLSRIFDQLTPLAAPSRASLRRALTEPAARLGVRFEDEALVDEMLDAVEGERGALPLLAFAVAMLFDNRDRQRDRLTRTAYQAMGGVAGALARHAEATLQQVGPGREEIVREIFRSLVTAQGTRAEAEREALLAPFPNRSAATQVLQHLIDARLLTAYSAPDASGTSDSRVEVVHESLLRAWPRLGRWQTQDLEGHQLRDQVRQAAQAWAARGRSADLLWSGTAYRELELWRERYQGQLSDLESQFADAMRARDRRRKRLVRLASAAGVVASLALTAAVDRSRRQEAAARDLAEAQRFVALGRLELDVDPTAALAYARKSLEHQDSLTARRLVIEALWRGPTARVIRAPAEVICSDIAASADGRFVACGSWGGRRRPAGPGGLELLRRATVRLDIVAPSVERSPADPGIEPAAVWSIDGRRVGSPASMFVGWTRTGGWQLRLTASGAGHLSGAGAGDVTAMVRTPYAKGRSLYLGPTTGETDAPVLIGRHAAEIVSAGRHSATGDVISVDERREVRVWSGPRFRLRHTRRGLDAGTLSLPSLDSKGALLAWRSVAERALVVWDLQGPPDAEPLLMRRRSLGGHVGDAVFLGEGRFIAGLVDGSIALWPTEMPWPRILRGRSLAVVEARFSPAGKRLVSCATEGARLWPLGPDDGHQRAVDLGRSYSCYGVALDSAGGEVLIAAPTLGLFVAPLAGGPARALARVPATAAIRAAALSPDGRWAATAAVSSAELEDRQLYLVDRRTRRVRRFPLPGAGRDSTDAGGVYALRFVSDGSLLAVGDAGLLKWDPATGRSQSILSQGCGTMGVSVDGRRVVVGCLAETATSPGRVGTASEVFVLDVELGELRRIDSHGQSVQAVAVDASGRVIATGDNAGVVRVGSIDGSEPHLLLGAKGVVSSLDLSPDGRWLASAVGNDVWLWPVPDISRPPLHTLPLAELLSRIDGFTNLRLVEDQASSSGQRLALTAFRGWETTPAW